MEFIEELNILAKNSLELKDEIQTKEAVKHSLVMPFLALLGYNIFNPKEVVPEYTSDPYSNKRETIDYALIHDGVPHIIIEIKGPDSKLTDHFNHLYRYFNSLRKAKFAVLTNGIFFQFFSDLDEPDILDKTPFLTIDIENLKEYAIIELEKFHKKKYDKEIILSTANDLKYTIQIKELLIEQIKKPDEDFIRYILKNVYNGNLTLNVIEKFKPLIIKAISLFANEMKTYIEVKIEEERKGKQIENLEENSDWYTIKELIQKDTNLYGIKPEKIKLPDNDKEIIINKWTNVVEKVLFWLYDNKKLNQSHCPIYAGKKIFLINTSPVHPTGKDFKTKINLYDTIYVNTHYNSQSHLRNLIKIFDIIGVSSNSFKIMINKELNYYEGERDEDQEKDEFDDKYDEFKEDEEFEEKNKDISRTWYTIETLMQKDKKLYGVKPEKIKLPDSNEIAVHTWSNLIEKVLCWLYDNKKLKQSHCPISSGKKRYYIHTSPIHPTGKKFFDGVRINNNIYVETNYSAPIQLKNLIYTLDTIGVGSNGFKIMINEEFAQEIDENEDEIEEDQEEPDEIEVEENDDEYREWYEKNKEILRKKRRE